jgi:glycosyltransferase involved in cell wall biosynthesis
MAGDPSIFGGGKRGFLQLMANLNKDAFKFYSCCALNKEQENLLKGLNGNIVNIDLQHEMIWIAMAKLISFLRKEKIDIIHSQGARADVFARMASKLSGNKIEVINTVQMLVEGYHVNIIRKKMYCAIDRFTERFVSKFIVVSENLKKRLNKDHQISKQNIVKIYNGIETHEYLNMYSKDIERGVRCEFDIEDTELLICSVGRMVWQKGFEFLINAIPEVVRVIPNAKFLLVGDGPLRGKLGALSKELRVRDKVIFTGFRSDIKEILSAIDILVIPSLLEGFPMITLEAMAMAKPIVATNIDGITEQITDEVNGILVLPKNPSALTKAVIRVLNDKELAMTMGLAAREKVEQEFSVEEMVAETEKVYLSLLKAG